MRSLETIARLLLTRVSRGLLPSQAEIPYRELHSFHVITGDGKRKPGISFEHKPNIDTKGTDIRVWMTAELATDCAEKLMQMLSALARQYEFEKEFKADEDGDDT